MSEPIQPDPRRWAESVQWLQRADEDIRLAEKIASDPDFLASAAFHCQQAAEKMAKAVIVAYRPDYPRVHDVAQLGLAVAVLHPELGASIVGLSGLTDWYVTPRYPGLEYRPSRQDVETTLHKSKELRRQIETFAPKPGE
jgi:HEPN domain-containing protein